MVTTGGSEAITIAMMTCLNEGDEVIVFNDEYKIEELAKQIKTIPYEILTTVSQRVKRVYFYE